MIWKHGASLRLAPGEEAKDWHSGTTSRHTARASEETHSLNLHVTRSPLRHGVRLALPALP